MLTEMRQIVTFGEGLGIADVKNAFLLKDYSPLHKLDLLNVFPTYLPGFNQLSGIGGMRSPQLSIIMAPPKGFKTGTLVNFATGYVRRGVPMFYADAENGADDIRIRHYQCMLGMTDEEVKEKENQARIAKMVELYKVRGGDIFVADFQANDATMQDVEIELERLRDEESFIPKGIIWDYIDLFTTSRKYTETRRKIQLTYMDAKNLLKNWDMFGISVSQVNRDAVDKEFIDMTAYAEDFGKAANADASYALCQTKAEKKARIARYIPVALRKGAEFTGDEVVNVRVDKDTQQITEISYEEALEALKAVIDEDGEPERPRRPKRKVRGAIRDE
jgi:KaiC/GvpD/RAD55 family RecA-like ATPase